MKFCLELRFAFLAKHSMESRKFHGRLRITLQKGPFLLVRFLWANKENEQILFLRKNL